MNKLIIFTYRIFPYNYTLEVVNGIVVKMTYI